MTELPMKGITCCGDCDHYIWNQHRCSVCDSVKADGEKHFFDDCPLPDAVRKDGPHSAGKERERILKIVWDVLHEGLSIDREADQDFVYERIRRRAEDEA